MKYLIFLGAGASRPFNIPTMQEMVNEFEKYLSLEAGGKSYLVKGKPTTTHLQFNEVVIHNEDEVIKCQLKITHEPPFEKNLILMFASNQRNEVEIAVYLQGRHIGGKTTVATQAKIDEPYLSEPITIYAHQLFAS